MTLSRWRDFWRCGWHAVEGGHQWHIVTPFFGAIVYNFGIDYMRGVRADGYRVGWRFNQAALTETGSLIFTEWRENIGYDFSRNT